jgi:hypothetical protein
VRRWYGVDKGWVVVSSEVSSEQVAKGSYTYNAAPLIPANNNCEQHAGCLRLRERSIAIALS